MATKLDQAGLVRVERQRDLLKPHTHCIEEATGVVLMLEAGHQIIGIAHDNHVAGRLVPSPAPGPQGEGGGQVDWDWPGLVDTLSLSPEVLPMPRTRPPYSPEFRRQMVDLVRAGRNPDDLAREFEPSERA